MRITTKATEEIKSLGLLERIKPDKGGHWKVVKKTDGKV
jgi:hypothetical protein